MAFRETSRERRHYRANKPKNMFETNKMIDRFKLIPKTHNLDNLAMSNGEQSLYYAMPAVGMVKETHFQLVKINDRHIALAMLTYCGSCHLQTNDPNEMIAHALSDCMASWALKMASEPVIHTLLIPFKVKFANKNIYLSCYSRESDPNIILPELLIEHKDRPDRVLLAALRFYQETRVSTIFTHFGIQKECSTRWSTMFVHTWLSKMVSKWDRVISQEKQVSLIMTFGTAARQIILHNGTYFTYKLTKNTFLFTFFLCSRCAYVGTTIDKTKLHFKFHSPTEPELVQHYNPLVTLNQLEHGVQFKIESQDIHEASLVTRMVNVGIPLNFQSDNLQVESMFHSGAWLSPEEFRNTLLRIQPTQAVNSKIDILHAYLNAIKHAQQQIRFTYQLEIEPRYGYSKVKQD